MNINELFSDDMADAGKRLWERRRRKISESKKQKVTENSTERYLTLALMDRLENQHPELIRRYGNDDIMDAIMDVTDYISDRGGVDMNRLDTYVTDVAKRLEGDLDESKCPHCVGEMISEDRIDEKKDACYYKVKSRYKVWPSAYASGALVKCRKKGAKNWGNKSESIDEDEQLDEDLKKWFKEKWVRFGPDGKIKGDCARGKDSEGKPKCLPQSKAHALGKKGRASAARRKRKQDPNPERRGKAINVATKKNESVMSDMDIDMQDITWDQIVGAVTIAVRIGEDADKFIRDWADQESIDMQRIEQELQERGFENIDVLQDHIEQHGGRYVPPDFDLSETIRKIGDNKYRLYSGKGKNLGTFDSRAGAEKHEREVQYFKHANESQITDQEIAAYLREMRDAGYGV